MNPKRNISPHPRQPFQQATRMLITFLAIFSSQAFGRQWTVHWEAAKGETECSIVYEPRTLDELRSKLPAGHPEANADIKKGAAPAKASTKRA